MKIFGGGASFWLFDEDLWGWGIIWASVSVARICGHETMHYYLYLNLVLERIIYLPSRLVENVYAKIQIILVF
jgi:hypothetical protein